MPEGISLEGAVKLGEEVSEQYAVRSATGSPSLNTTKAGGESEVDILLAGDVKVVQSDGFVVYDEFDTLPDRLHLCCWAHVTAGIGGHSYMNYQKVPAKVEELCSVLQEKQKAVETLREQYTLSFNAHLNLVTIHPWVDGNGRTARLLMNYIQFCYHLFPAKIFKEDREEYILSLRQFQEEETNQPFLDFMAMQLKKSLALEIERFKASQKKGLNLIF